MVLSCIIPHQLYLQYLCEQQSPLSASITRRTFFLLATSSRKHARGDMKSFEILSRASRASALKQSFRYRLSQLSIHGHRNWTCGRKSGSALHIADLLELPLTRVLQAARDLLILRRPTPLRLTPLIRWLNATQNCMLNSLTVSAQPNNHRAESFDLRAILYSSSDSSAGLRPCGSMSGAVL